MGTKRNSYNRNNSFATKWTIKAANDKLDEMIDILIKSEDKDKKPIYSISKLLSKCGLYNRFPSYLREKFGDNEKIMNKLDYIFTTTEANLFEKGINDHRTNGALVQFGLRAFHQRYDEQHINLNSNHSGEINVNLIPSKGLEDDLKDE